MRILVGGGDRRGRLDAGRARRARRRRECPSSALVVHGNNKSDEELRAAAAADAWLVVMDEPGEVERCVAAGVKRVLLRITPGIEADGAREDHDRAPGLEVRRRARGRVEISAARATPASRCSASTSTSARRSLDARAGPLDRRAGWPGLSTEARAKLGWTPEIVNLGGGLGIRYVARRAGAAEPGGVRAVGVGAALASVWAAARPAEAAAGLRAGPVARRPGRASRSTASASSSAAARRPGWRWTVACPTTPAQRSTARATRHCWRTAPTSPPTGTYAVCGKHCESGDVLIERVGAARAEARRPARDPGDRRVRPVDGVELQRGPEAGRTAARRRLRCHRGVASRGNRSWRSGGGPAGSTSGCR